MTTTVLSVILLCLVLRASFSFIIPLDVKTVDLSRVLEHEKEITPAVLDPHLRPGEDTKLGLSLTLVDAYPSVDPEDGEWSRRIKRAVMTTSEKCAKDMVELAKRCVTKEQYKILTEGDGED